MAFDVPYSVLKRSTTPESAGSLSFAFGNFGGDNVGIVIDNLKLTGAVPETAGWALMIGGFGSAGGALRRRARKATIAIA